MVSSFSGSAVAQCRCERERATGGVGDAPQPAMRGGVCLVLPGMRVRWATPGVQVMDEECGHEDLGCGRFEDLDAEPVRAGVCRCQYLVLHDRPGACRWG